MRQPSIGHNVAQLMAELICELNPGTLADVHNDPGHGASVLGVQPDHQRPDVCSSTRSRVG